MVIIVSREGQLANRILHASSFIVNAQEYRYKVLHLFFDEYYTFFSESLDKKATSIRFCGKRKSWSISFFQRSVRLFIKILLRLGIKRLPFFEIVDYKGYKQDLQPYDLNDEKFIKKARSKLVLVYGWLFRDDKHKKKYKSLLIETWSPNKRYRNHIENYYQRYKKDHDVLVGVHIRGGDYKRFEGGKWYYTPDQYYTKMKEIAGLKILREKKIAFIICTNEKNLSFPGTDSFSIFHEERHFIEDLYLLANCDYIIGPPSTFSIWASFYGEVPLYMMKKVGIPVSDEMFTLNN